MPVEIERKFLVTGTEWRHANGIHLCQGYLSRGKEATVRVRIAGERGFLTIKGITKGTSRAEFKYEIPVEDAKHLLKLCKGQLSTFRCKRIKLECSDSASPGRQ